jgi:TRAP-type uncharacterized transport system substrate-binding protein
VQLTPYVAAIAGAVLSVFSSAAWAQNATSGNIQVAQARDPGGRHAVLTRTLNANTVTIISGNPNGGFLYTAYDMSAVLDRGKASGWSELRVLPVVGKGGAQNIKDVLYLKGIDMGIMHPHIIRYYQETGELGPSIDKRIAYITSLFPDELHLVVNQDINSLEDLRGKTVNFSDVGSGTQLSMKIMFKILKLDVQEANVGQTDAFEAMKRGEMVATTCTCVKPLRSVGSIKPDSGMKLLPVPYTRELEEYFLPGKLTHEDYPNLIGKDQDIQTISVQTILGVYNWPRDTDRYRRVASFVEAFFDNLEKFHQPPRQPKWKGVNIAASVKGLQRFPAAQEWLDRKAVEDKQRRTTVAIDPSFVRAQAAKAAPNNPAEQERLFQQFMEWAKGRPTR